jgi:hypothetical protein
MRACEPCFVFRWILDRDPAGDAAAQLAIAKFKTADQLITKLEAIEKRRI